MIQLQDEEPSPREDNKYLLGLQISLFPASLEMYLLQLILRQIFRTKTTDTKSLGCSQLKALLLSFLAGHVAERSSLMGSFSETLKQGLPNEHPSAKANINNTLGESGQACRLIKILKLLNKALPPNPSSLDSGII